MEKIISYKDLKVWQKGILLCEEIYIVTEKFPKDERYGLILQIRRCAVSIPSNIAEGQRRGHTGEFLQFLRIAFGSGAELETQLLISLNIGYLNKANFERLSSLLEEIMKMLNKLITLISQQK